MKKKSCSKTPFNGTEFRLVPVRFMPPKPLPVYIVFRLKFQVIFSFTQLYPLTYKYLFSWLGDSNFRRQNRMPVKDTQTMAPLVLGLDVYLRASMFLNI